MKLTRGLVVGSCAVIFALSGASLVACGSDDNTGFPTSTTKKDASVTSPNGDDDSDATTGDDNADSAAPPGDDDNGDDDDASMPGDDTIDSSMPGTDSGDAGGGTNDAGDGGDGGVACKALPGIPDSGVNTCFKANNDAGCSGSTPVCCDIDVKSKFTDVCVATVSACVVPADAGADGGDAGGSVVAYQCGSPSDCVAEDAGANAKCFLQPSATFDGGTLTPTACGIVNGSSGTICTTGTPLTGSLQICSTTANCGTGKTCTNVEASGKFFGACL